jgi:hypothetical protein
VKQRTDREALATVREVLGSVARHNQEGQALYPPVRALAERMALSDSQIPGRLLDRLEPYEADPDLMRQVRAYTADAAAYRLFESSKVAYAMDDYLLGELSESSADKVPTDILRDLPHANPFVLLPSPNFEDEDTRYYSTHIGLPAGAFVYGKRDSGKYMCSTTDPRLDVLGIMFAGEIMSHGRSCFQVLRCSMPLDGDRTSVDEAVATTVKGFRWSSDIGESDPKRLEAWLRRYLTQVFSSVLYVCTDQPDVEVYRPAATTAKQKARKPRRPRAGDIESLVKVGWRLGPELFAERQRYEREDRVPAGDGTRRSPRAHRRRPTWMTYHTGPGGSVPKLKWRKAHWVNTHRLNQPGDGPADVVVRPVR